MFLIHKPGTGTQVQSRDFPLNSINLGKVFDGVLEVFKFDGVSGYLRLTVTPNTEGRWSHYWMQVTDEEWGRPPAPVPYVEESVLARKEYEREHELGGEGG